MNRIVQIILFFLIQCAPAIKAQDITALPKLSPSYVEDFSDYNSFPSTCFERAVQGKDGKLWLFTCGIARSTSSLFLFQFDGYQFRMIKGALEQLSTDAILLGMLNEQTLIGIERTQEINQLFFYALDKDSLSFQPLAIKGFIDNGILTNDNEVILTVFLENDFMYYQWSNDRLTELAKVSRDIEPSETYLRPSFIPLSFTQKGGWIFHTKKEELIRADFKTGGIQSFPLHDFGATLNNPNTPIEVYATFNCRVHPKDFNYFRLTKGDQNLVLQYNREKDSLEVLKGVPANWRIELTFKDEIGNVIFVFKDLNDQDHAILEDTEGNHFDYSELLKPLKGTKIDNMESSNFKEQVIISSHKGILLQKIKNRRAIQHFLPGISIRSMVELPNQQILISSQNQGIHLLDLKTGNTSLYTVEGCNFQKNSTHFEITKDPTGYYWMSYRDRLTKFNPSDQSCEYHPVDVSGISLFCFLEEHVLALIADRRLLLHNLITQKTSPVLVDQLPVEFPGRVHDIYYDDASNQLWGATTKGLYKVHLGQLTMEVFGNEAPFLDNRFMCIEPDERGRLWLGTPLGGLHIYDPQTQELIILNSEKGLGNNTIASILIDNEGDRWLGTYNGITVVNPEGELLMNLNLEDGLEEKENNRYATLKTKDNRLLMGTISGVHLIDPDIVKEQLKNPHDLKIYLSELTYFDKKPDKNKTQTFQLEQLPTLRLPASKRFLNLRFALSNYIKPKENQFAYKLEGIDEDWTFLGNQPSLNLNNLPPGKYSLLIKGSDPFGSWTSTPLNIPIHAQAFIYEQPWFYLLLLLFLSSIAFLWIYQLRIEVRRATQQIRKDKAVIEAQAEQLKDLDKAKARFFTNISHEFRTPLTVILGMANRLKEEPMTWVEKGSSMIIRNCNNLLNLVNQILDLRKLESGSLKLNMVQGNIIPYLQYIFESFQSLAQSKNLHFHFLNGQKELLMDYDPEKTLRIVSNLLSNAIKFTPEGGNIYLIIEKDPYASPPKLYIKVKDSGVGIPPQKLPQIFNRFYQVDRHTEGIQNKTDTQHGEGTGIGLALTKELVKLLGGEIQVESVVGKGSVFILALPIQQKAALVTKEDHMRLSMTPPNLVDTAAVSEVSPSTLTKSDGEERPLVLLIEDNKDVILYLEACLERQFRLARAGDGQQGVEKAIELIPDAIISDIMMPNMDGYEVCDTLKNDERTSHIPIILLTARADAASRLSGLRKGADDYLTKPFNEEELLIRLNNLMAIRQKLQDYFRHANTTSSLVESEFKMENTFLQKVRKELESNISDEDYGILHICRALGLSRTQLHRKIKALTGQSTSHYLRRIRLNKAKELLEATQLNISEIAYEVGFRHPNYFTRSFMEEFGINPSDIRKA